MIEWLLSFVPWWGWSLSGLALAGAAWTYLGARAGLGVLVGAAIWTAYMGGIASERARGEAAKLSAELAIARDDLAKARRAETDAAARTIDLEAAARSNQDIIDDLTARNAAQHAEAAPVEPIPPAAEGAPPAPAGRPCRCAVTGDDERILRQLR